MDKNVQEKSVTNKHFLWISASLISVVLLMLVLVQVDMSQLGNMLNNLSWGMLAMAFLFLCMEGVLTALRLWWFSGRKSCIGAALKANAWYVLLLVVLPARLGEVAAIVVLERHLGQKYGAAAMSIIAQRLYDVMVLGLFFLIALLGLGRFVDMSIMVALAVLIITFSLFVLIRLDMFLTILVVVLRRLNGQRKGLTGKIIRLVLQARIYTRHNLKYQGRSVALLLTVGKWVSNLGALIFLFMAIYLDLTFFENVTVAAAYNFLAIIPIQTVGGIGVGEAGLTLLLVSMGVVTSIAAASSLVIRFVILVFPFIFWGMVMGGVRFRYGAENDQS